MPQVITPLCLVLSLPVIAEAATTRVSTVASLARAVSTAEPGDTIEVAAGRYSLNLSITRDGTASAPITLRAAAGATVVFSAQDPNFDTVALSSASHWRLRDLKIRGSRHAMVSITGGTDVILDDLEIYDGTKKGIIANGDAIIIENSTIRDIAQPVAAGADTQGIAIWRGSRIRIHDNMIATPGDGVLIGGAGALSRTSTDIKIYRNHFHTLKAWQGVYNVENAVDLKNGAGVRVTDNVIHRYHGATGTDGGLALVVHTNDRGAPELDIDGVAIENNQIYDVGRGLSVESIGALGTNVAFRRNLVYAALAANEAERDELPGGVFVGDWSGIRVEQNTFVDIDHAALHTYGTVTGLKFLNNILRRTDGIVRENRGGTIDYTCRYSTPATGGGHDVYGNQRFVDDGGRDYHLQPSSPCIDKGTDLGLTFVGGKPDIGRYEYGGTGELALASSDPAAIAPSVPEAGEGPPYTPKDGKPADWAADASDAQPDGELGGPIVAETPADDLTALEEDDVPIAARSEDESTDDAARPDPGATRQGCGVLGAGAGGLASALLVLGALGIVAIRRRPREAASRVGATEEMRPVTRLSSGRRGSRRRAPASSGSPCPGSSRSGRALPGACGGGARRGRPRRWSRGRSRSGRPRSG